MAAVVVRNIPEATHKALKARAKLHGRSAEAEVRIILAEALHGPAGRGASGKEIFDALHALGQKYGGIELDITRDKTPPRDIEFE